jgi:hypothetical protein
MQPNSQIQELTSRTEKGDCGSWVLDPTNGNWLGHIIAGRPGTSVAYIALARDIVKDITDQLGIQTVQMACEAELEVTEAIGDIKKTFHFDEPSTSYQGLSGGVFTPPVEAIALTEDSSVGSTTPQDPLSKSIQSSFSETTWSLLLFRRKQTAFGGPRWVQVC